MLGGVALRLVEQCAEPALCGSWHGRAGHQRFAALHLKEWDTGASKSVPTYPLGIHDRILLDVDVL
jgi:hypothetical protein